LFLEKNCILQLGGSDQWGNITNGCDLVKKILKKEVFGLTTPLLVTSSGKKFGKSEVIKKYIFF
jgi:tyrosyl-tRNA synthetase